MTIKIHDQFLSEEDLDLKTLSDADLERVWTAWLKQAQITNDRDRYTYSHGVFTVEPAATLAATDGWRAPPPQPAGG